MIYEGFKSIQVSEIIPSVRRRELAPKACISDWNLWCLRTGTVLAWKREVPKASKLNSNIPGQGSESFSFSSEQV